jgi:hypothetical protein
VPRLGTAVLSLSLAGQGFAYGTIDPSASVSDPVSVRAVRDSIPDLREGVDRLGTEYSVREKTVVVFVENMGLSVCVHVVKSLLRGLNIYIYIGIYTKIIK